MPGFDLLVLIKGPIPLYLEDVILLLSKIDINSFLIFTARSHRSLETQRALNILSIVFSPEMGKIL